MTADTTASPSGAEARAFVLLKSRRRLDLLNPDPHAWTDDDLAAGLSRTMRWAGRHDGNIRCPSPNIA
jgi:hypothetical protein